MNIVLAQQTIGFYRAGHFVSIPRAVDKFFPHAVASITNEVRTIMRQLEGARVVRSAVDGGQVKYRWAAGKVTGSLTLPQLDVLSWVGDIRVATDCAGVRSASGSTLGLLTERCVSAYNRLVAFPVLTGASLTEAHIDTWWYDGDANAHDMMTALGHALPPAKSPTAEQVLAAREKIATAINRANQV